MMLVIRYFSDLPNLYFLLVYILNFAARDRLTLYNL
jgi:hypothetical protein